RFALGGGFSLLAVALMAARAAPLLLTAPARANADQIRLAAGALLLACAGTFFVLRWRAADAGETAPALPLPACGLLPVAWGGALASFSERQAAGTVVVSLTLTAALAVGLGYLFNRPSKVQAFGPGAASRVRRAVAQSAVYVVGLGAFGWVIGWQLGDGWVSVIPFVALTALCLDVIAEAQAVRSHG